MVLNLFRGDAVWPVPMTWLEMTWCEILGEYCKKISKMYATDHVEVSLRFMASLKKSKYVFEPPPPLPTPTERGTSTPFEGKLWRWAYMLKCIYLWNNTWNLPWSGFQTCRRAFPHFPQSQITFAVLSKDRLASRPTVSSLTLFYVHRGTHMRVCLREL